MALIETIAATMLGGGFALLGSWMTNKFNKQNAEAQRQHEKWKSKRDSYLTKGEEAYSIFNQWAINVTKITTIYSFRMKGAYDAEQLKLRLEAINMQGLKPKLTTLIEIYFPELSLKFKELQEIVADAHLYYACSLDEVPDVDISREIVKKGAKFTEEANVFLEELSSLIKSRQ